MSFQGIRNGRLVVFEGIDGTGKSTHIKYLRAYLEEKGIEVVQSYEPTHGQWGKKLRDSASTGRLSIEEEVELFLKDRREHVESLIGPALERGAWVLLDRYYLSMMAYQGARGVNTTEIRRMNEEFAPIPDAVVWLDIPVSVALERIGNRGGLDAFETEAGLTACREVFASIHEPWMLRVDGDGTQEVVAERVRAALAPMLNV
ncbi:MAG: dTMP kinase [Akkermansia sp.]|nr:dTMP kinase [Akkermansia sp.]